MGAESIEELVVWLLLPWFDGNCVETVFLWKLLFSGEDSLGDRIVVSDSW